MQDVIYLIDQLVSRLNAFVFVAFTLNQALICTHASSHRAVHIDLPIHIDLALHIASDTDLYTLIYTH